MVAATTPSALTRSIDSPDSMATDVLEPRRGAKVETCVQVQRACSLDPPSLPWKQSALPKQQCHAISPGATATVQTHKGLVSTALTAPRLESQRLVASSTIT